VRRKDYSETSSGSEKEVGSESSNNGFIVTVIGRETGK
jgi:hypothetical protein